MNIALHGFLFGLSLIIAIGPQNAYILKQGLKREGVLAIVLICAISDVILIIAGTAGIDALVSSAPRVITVLIWGGFAYLIYFAFTCFRDAFRTEALTAADVPSPQPMSTGHSPGSRPAWVTPALTALALTWLNPGAYIDTVVMIGSLANQHAGWGKWIYAAGAIAASFVWFPTVGFGARLLSGPLSAPATWRVLNIIIGVVMVGIAARLVL